jgi:hypothetical protein
MPKAERNATAAASTPAERAKQDLFVRKYKHALSEKKLYDMWLDLSEKRMPELIQEDFLTRRITLPAGTLCYFGNFSTDDAEPVLLTKSLEAMICDKDPYQPIEDGTLDDSCEQYMERVVRREFVEGSLSLKEAAALVQHDDFNITESPDEYLPDALARCGCGVYAYIGKGNRLWLKFDTDHVVVNHVHLPAQDVTMRVIAEMQANAEANGPRMSFD